MLLPAPPAPTKASVRASGPRSDITGRRRASAVRISFLSARGCANGRPWATASADDVGGQGGAQAGGDQALLGGVGRRPGAGRRGPGGSRARPGRSDSRRRVGGLEVGDIRRHRHSFLDRGAVRLRAVQAGVGRSRPRSGGGDQDLVGALADGALGARERVGERGGLVDQRLDRRRRQALGGGAVVARFERLLVGAAPRGRRPRRRSAGRSRATPPARPSRRRSTMASAPSSARILRQHLLEAAAAEGLGRRSRGSYPCPRSPSALSRDGQQLGAWLAAGLPPPAPRWSQR